jgi:FkbM family methyltransferase
MFSYVKKLIRTSNHCLEVRVKDAWRLGLPTIDPFVSCLELLMARRETGSEFTVFQVGANDGITDDPIHAYVINHGWRGVLVEPIPWVFQELKKTYAGVAGIVCENVAVAGHEGEAEIFYLDTFSDRSGNKLKRGLGGRIASLNRRSVVRERRVRSLEAAVRSIKVPIENVERLMQKHGLDEIHLLQIDAEGYDFEVLKLFPFEQTLPLLVHYEHRNLTWPEMRESWSFLAEKGYLLAQHGLDTTAILGSCLHMRDKRDKRDRPIEHRAEDIVTPLPQQSALGPL